MKYTHCKNVCVVLISIFKEEIMEAMKRDRTDIYA
jgi:cytochrome oxidase Cu insertion factor (SCO1/SenC/PrrC family)